MTDSTNKSLIELVSEWEQLINELSQKEIAYYEWKTVYQIKSDEITQNTDFKALYGANNQKVRDQHIRNELQDWHNIIKELEFSIDYLQRRINFLSQLVQIKGRLGG